MAADLAHEKALQAPKTLQVMSPDFRQRGLIPRPFTSFGEDVAPALEVGGVPERAQALAIVVEDPDAPGGTFTHWLVWNLPVTTTRVPRAANVSALGGVQGTNDFGFPRYMGPKPPSGTHHYHFRVFALSQPLPTPPRAKAPDVWRELAPRVLAWGETVGIFARP